MPLTDTAAKNARPKDKPYKLADAGGMYLEVSPSGGKWWRLKYRIGGKEKRISLGVYPDVSLSDARKARDAAKQMIKNGIDPGAHRKAEKAEVLAVKVAEEVAAIERVQNTFEAVAREWFSKSQSGWAPNHASKVIRWLERDIFPWVGATSIKEVRRADLLACLERIESRGAIDTAHRVKFCCGQVFCYAIDKELVEHNPIKDISKTSLAKRPKKQHFPAITDPRELATLLRAMEGYSGSLIVRSALKLSALLFVRPGELRHMEWSEIDLESSTWSIPAEKMKMKQPHLVPLCTQALEIIREIQPLTGKSKYVFPSERGNSRPISENTVNVALINLGYKDKHCAHGFRGTARTIMDEVLNIRPDYIEHQLAHAVKDPNGRAYNRTAHLPARREMMQAWADYLDGLRKGAEVVSINSKRA